VYGLGADARNAKAIGLIYAAKARPQTNPLIVHVHDVAAARGAVAPGAWNERAEKLAGAFWPGPLTMILRRGVGMSQAGWGGRWGGGGWGGGRGWWGRGNRGGAGEEWQRFGGGGGGVSFWGGGIFGGFGGDWTGGWAGGVDYA